MHLTPPINFRLGKTIPWKSNIAWSNQKNAIALGGELSTAIGLEKSVNQLLELQHFTVVRGVPRLKVKTNTLCFNLLYVPRMMEDPVDSVLTGSDAISEWLYSNRAPGGRYLDYLHDYFYNLKEKTIKLKPAAPKMRLGRWISKQMFRGTAKPCWRLRKRKRSTKKLNKRYKRITRFIKYRYCSYRQKRWLRIHKINKKIYLKKRKRFNAANRPLSDRLLTQEVSALLKKKIKIKSLNVFTYLVKKGLVTFKNHQRHFWIRAYRGRRWNYSNYWDLLNAFYLIGTIKHTEKLLLDILTTMLPRIEKLRRVFYFLDAVIKNLPQISLRFSCFRLTITGKLAGGTKRTKQFTVGFGRLAVNSLLQEATNNFASFAHRYGAFGLSLVMCRVFPTKSVEVQRKNFSAVNKS